MSKAHTRPHDIYVRVSQTNGRLDGGDRFQSPEDQRQKCKGHLALHDIPQGETFVDLDQSGGSLNRPGLQAILDRIERGEAGGIIVAKLDRLSRSVADGIAIVERIQKMGGQVISVGDQIDTGSANGRLIFHFFLSIAQWYRDTATEQWKASQARAQQRGAFAGRTPYGVRRLEDGTVELNADHAANVARMIRERAAGRGWKAIATGLSKDGIPTPGGNGHWSASTVAGIVGSKAALGIWEGPHGAREEHAWSPMIDRATWEAAQLVKGKRTDGRKHQDRLIAGKARCASCRRVLRRTTNQAGQVSYGCVNRGCPARASISAQLLDRYMSELVDERLSRLRMTAERATDDTYVSLVAARDATQDAVTRWLEDVEMEEELGPGEYRVRLRALRAKRDAAAESLAAHQRRTSPALDGLPTDRVVTLDELPRERRTQVCDAFLHAVFVRRPVRRGPRAAQDVAYRTRVEWADDHTRSELPSPSRPVMPPVDW